MLRCCLSVTPRFSAFDPVGCLRPLFISPSCNSRDAVAQIKVTHVVGVSPPSLLRYMPCIGIFFGDKGAASSFLVDPGRIVSHLRTIRTL